jgi:hypothetical protein
VRQLALNETDYSALFEQDDEKKEKCPWHDDDADRMFTMNKSKAKADLTKQETDPADPHG